MLHPLCLFAVSLLLIKVWSKGVLEDEGFIEELVASQYALTGSFIPNPLEPDTKPPMLLLSSKQGNVHVLTNPDESSETLQILDIEYNMCTNGERGMQSIVPHPKFALDNHWLYIYYTAFAEECLEDELFGPKNRLSRFIMDPETLRIRNETEEILMEGAPTNKFYHNGGAIKFGNDGKLYIATGDGGDTGQRTSQDMTNLHGSILRLNDDGSVPEDNPFTFQGGYSGVPCGQTGGVLPPNALANAVCSEIFSYGLRNPFRIVMDPAETEKTRFYVHDVGGAVWEEISEAGTDFPGYNYGWPQYEGPCKFDKTQDCPLYNPASNIPNRDQFKNPLYYYEHVSKREGGCITGGAFVPEGIWPAKYKYLFSDFIFHTIYNLVEDPANQCQTCLPPTPAYRNETFYISLKEEDQHVNYARIVDMFFGPYKDTQALYIFKMGAGDNIWRIRYTGSDNMPPVAIIAVNTTKVNVGDILAFDGSGSFDPEELGLAFQWDFGDGECISREVNPIHAYSRAGQYTVRLDVADSANHTQTDSVNIVVGTPPTLKMLSPAKGKQFFVGEVLILYGTSSDADGNPLADSQISWEVRKHHAGHWHPFLDEKVGNNMSLFPAPEPEDYLAATNSYLEIIMYAKDASGLISSTSRNVYPRTVEICVDTEPQGLEVFVDEYPIVTPLQITSWVNHELRLRTAANQVANDTDTIHRFTSWNDGVVTDDRFVRLLPDSNPGYLASFCVEGNENCVVEAQSRGALGARCPSKATTVSPTGTASASPTSAPTGMETQSSADNDNEEDWPIDTSSETPTVSPTASASPTSDGLLDLLYPETKDDSAGSSRGLWLAGGATALSAGFVLWV